MRVKPALTERFVRLEIRTACGHNLKRRNRHIHSSILGLTSLMTVQPKPEKWNPAHAAIPRRIPRGLVNPILPELQLHHPPGAGDQDSA